MQTIVIILLIVIAYILWLIYRQKEEEKEKIADEKYEVEQKDQFKEYPNLIGKINYVWLELFGKVYIEKDLPHLKAMYLIYLGEANNTKLDLEIDQSIEMDGFYDRLWNLSEELLEHLEKYHKSSKYEFEIAILTYWQIIGQYSDSFIGKDFETIKKALQSTPFTDIQKIPSWFPKNDKHPEKEISFMDDNGEFPRESKGSSIIHDRLKELGL